MSTRILGISAYYHDSAAAIICDGVILAAAQEERFTRIKHDPAFPKNAVEFCLDQAGCAITEIDAIIFYDKPLLKFERLLETYLANAPRGFTSFLKAMPVWLKEKLYLKQVLRKEFRSLGGIGKKATLPRLLFSEHHLSHAGSAFFPSPFKEAAVLCLDGVGEWATSTAWAGLDGQLKPLWEIQFPHSLGLLYSAFTYFAGFKVNAGEYKLMGLAPYGLPIYAEKILDSVVHLHDDGSFALDMSYFNFATGLTMTNDKFASLFGGPPRKPTEEVSQREMDIASSIQVVTEKIILKIVQNLHRISNSKNLCLAGGVALNCVANGKILQHGPFENIWIQPAAGDAGGALGAALVAWHHYYSGERALNSHSMDTMCGALLGPEYSDQLIIDELQAKGLNFSVFESDGERDDSVAKLIAEGKVIGWFQGKMEFGPRALGNRSILGDARCGAMQKRMNLKIKERESFRPFAPAVLEEDASQYFKLDVASPYMLLVAEVRDELRMPTDKKLQGIAKLDQQHSSIPAVTHVDYSARVQTVDRQTNPTFYNLIAAFKKISGCGMVINTSFNVRGEPPVCSPQDATRCFLATDMDYLVMGNIILDKKAQTADAIAEAKSVTFELD